MNRNHFVVWLATVGVVGFSGSVSGCGHTEVAAVVPAAPPPPAIVAVAPPPPPPTPKLTAPCDATIGPAGWIKFPKEVEFEVGKATLKTSDTTSTILQCLVDFLNNNKMVTRFRIEGHTDNAGDPAANMTLSQQRAEAVVAWMVAHGINPGMVWAKGFGPTQPRAPNDTPEHMAQNRRVEFHIDQINGAKATKENIAAAENPPAPVSTTAIVTTPAVGVAVAAPAPAVGVVVAAPTPVVGVSATLAAPTVDPKKK